MWGPAYQLREGATLEGDPLVPVKLSQQMSQGGQKNPKEKQAGPSLCSSADS